MSLHNNLLAYPASPESFVKAYDFSKGKEWSFKLHETAIKTLCCVDDNLFFSASTTGTTLKAWEPSS